MGILAVVLLAVNNLHAFTLDGPQTLDDWTEDYVVGNFTSTTSGTQMQLDVSGSEGVANGIRYKEFSNAIGVLATFNVSSLGGDMVVGLGQYVGTTAAGNLIRARIYLDIFDTSKRIAYSVEERTTDFQWIRTLAYGFVGNYSGGWTVGQDVTLAFARLGDDIYFYTPGSGAYVIVRPFEAMGTISDDSFHYITSWAASGAENYFTATVSQVNMVYP